MEMFHLFCIVLTKAHMNPVDGWIHHWNNFNKVYFGSDSCCIIYMLSKKIKAKAHLQKKNSMSTDKP